jgi:hypothetical protein
MTGPVDVTGWWAEIHQKFTLAFTPSLVGVAGSRSYAQQPLALTPVLAAGGQGHSGVSTGQLILPFAVAVTTVGAAVPQASMGLALPSAVAASAQGHSGVTAATMTLPFTVQIAASSGVPATPATAQIDVTPTLALAAAGAEHYTAATTLADAVTVTTAGAARYAAAAPLSDTAAITATGAERYSAAAGLSLTPAVTATGTLAAAPIFDAVSTTGAGPGAFPATWTHPAGAASRDVYVVVAMYNDTPTSVKCGTFAMTLVGTASGTLNSTGQVSIYRTTGIGAATKTMTVTATNQSSWAATSISYSGVTSVATPTKVLFTTAPASYSQATTCAANQIVLQAFQNSSDAFFTAYSGGTSRAMIANMLTVSDATANTTFTATLTTGDYGSGIAVVLS